MKAVLETERLLLRHFTESDAESPGEFVRYKALAGVKAALKHIRQQRLDDRVSAVAMIASKRRFGQRGAHGWETNRAGGIL